VPVDVDVDKEAPRWGLRELRRPLGEEEGEGPGLLAEVAPSNPVEGLGAVGAVGVGGEPRLLYLGPRRVHRLQYATNTEHRLVDLLAPALHRHPLLVGPQRTREVAQALQGLRQVKERPGVLRAAPSLLDQQAEVELPAVPLGLRILVAPVVEDVGPRHALARRTDALLAKHLVGGPNVAPPSAAAGEARRVVAQVVVVDLDVIGSVPVVPVAFAEVSQRGPLVERLVAAEHQGEDRVGVRQVEGTVAGRGEVHEGLLDQLAVEAGGGLPQRPLGAVGGAGVQDRVTVDPGPHRGQGRRDGAGLVLDDHHQREQGPVHGDQRGERGTMAAR
jgi:hypothetical protein